MDYIELNIPVQDQTTAEIITAELSELPFESFATEAQMLKAYIPADKLCDCKADADMILSRYGIEGSRYISIETQNWNALWESNFPPVEVDGRVAIRAPFHAPYPDYELDIVIMPKMSFGTGHHATTYLMSRLISAHDYTGHRCLDMGSGTGVLAIIAAKLGAEHVDAVDIDDWAYENCAENIAANGVAERVVPLLGDAGLIAGKTYDDIFANINRNILLSDMPRYAAALRQGGRLTMSGILDADTQAVVGCAEKHGMKLSRTERKDGWTAVEVVKM